MDLYQRSVLKSYLASVDVDTVKSAYERYRSHFLHPEKQKNIRLSKEEQYQEGFLRELFVDVLGYTINPTVGYNLVTEQQNITDQKKLMLQSL
ncbi:MAG: hypothetical protein IPN10_13640 [Saprospiraceae bacterium]|nr:hypothetical protein [Saprospiraceae bacterium]